MSEEMNVTDMCEQPKRINVLFPEQRTHNDFKLFCRTIEGNMTAITSDKMQKELLAAYKIVHPNPTLEFGELRFF